MCVEQKPFLFWVAIISILLLPGFGSAGENTRDRERRAKELEIKIEKLVRELYALEDNKNIAQAESILQKIDVLRQEYRQLKGIKEEHTPGEFMNAAEKELKGMEDHPCYYWMVRDKANELQYGENRAFVYSPVFITVIWDIDTSCSYLGGVKDQLQYVREEKYPGCLVINYYQDKREKEKIEGILIEAATGKNIKKTSNYKKFYAKVLGCRSPCKYPRDTIFVETKDPLDFRPSMLHGSDDNFEGFSYIHRYNPITKSHSENMYINVCGIWPKETLFKRAYELLSRGEDHWGFGEEGARTWTRDEIFQGMEKGELVKEFPIIELPFARCKVREGGEGKGTVKVKIDFKVKTGSLEVTPADNFYSCGPDKYGRFTPSSKTYTLRNRGKQTIGYKVVKTKKWLSLSNASGQIPPKASTVVKVAINEAVAKGLDEDVHSDTISFLNTTNGKGNTSRKVTVDVGETQTWVVTMTGQELDDMGGSSMIIKMKNVWRQVTVDYGIRFDYTMGAKFTIKKQKGKWVYKTGMITRAEVKFSSNFAAYVFYPCKYYCLNCQDVPNLKGKSIDGYVYDNTVKLLWPWVITKVIARNKIRLEFESKDESHKGWSDNWFESAEFFHRAHDHDIPLTDGSEKSFSVIKESSKHRFRLDKRPPVSLFWRYYIKRVK